jgi:BlaI family transcriptional regulator, penicillinase repressor
MPLTLTELQIDLVAVLWERGEATTAEVYDALRPSRGLALSTVATLLSRLERRGVVAYRKDGRQYVYRACVSRSDVRRSMVRDLTRSLFGGDATALVRHLVEVHDVDTEQVARMGAAVERPAAAEGAGR